MFISVAGNVIASFLLSYATISFIPFFDQTQSSFLLLSIFWFQIMVYADYKKKTIDVNKKKRRMPEEINL